MNKIQKRVFFGYDRNAFGEFVLWEEQAEVVKYIFATYACGHSLAFITNELEQFNIAYTLTLRICYSIISKNTSD